MAPPIVDQLLWIDSPAGSVESTPILDEWRRRYIGGKELDVCYFYDGPGAGVDPFGGENAMLFVLSPPSGYLPGESKYAAITRSPLTGCFLDSYAGDEFPDSLASALGPHMGLLVTGVASELVCFVIEDGDATIKPAETREAGTVGMTQVFLSAAVACIGPAGERRVVYATIAFDAGGHHAGRGGAGVVMGSKRLRAVVARGTPPDADGLDNLRDAYTVEYQETDTGWWLRAGETVETVDFANEINTLLVRGWNDGQFEAAKELDIATVEDRAVGRERVDTETPGGYRVAMGDDDHVLRGATAMTFGTELDIDDSSAVAVLGQTCGRLGMDLTGTESAVAWMVRVSAAGMLDRSLSFDEPDGARALLQEIAERELEPGDTLADGVEAAATRFDGCDPVPTMKPIELPTYDPRGTQSMVLVYTTSSQDACHRRVRPIEHEAFDGDRGTNRTMAEAIRRQDWRSTLWNLIADDFSGGALDDLGRGWLESVGPDSAGGLTTVDEWIQNVTRLFNVHGGISREDGSLPAVLQEPLESGPRAGMTVDRDDFDSMLDTYYRRRSWTADGVPTTRTIGRLGLAALTDGSGTLDD